nr:MAG TPA: hypothetical protein [Caudoviricetes sp.]
MIIAHYILYCIQSMFIGQAVLHNTPYKQIYTLYSNVINNSIIILLHILNGCIGVYGAL